MERGLFRFSMPGLSKYWFYVDGVCYLKTGNVRKMAIRQNMDSWYYVLTADNGDVEHVHMNEIKQYGKHVMTQYEKIATYYTPYAQTIKDTLTAA